MTAISQSVGRATRPSWASIVVILGKARALLPLPHWRRTGARASGAEARNLPLPTSPSLRDLESTPPSTALRITVLTLVALVAILLAWTLTAKLDIVATAPGKLVPASQVKTVQAADAGIVRELLVRDGEPVRAGQTLLRMDATLAGADARSIANELANKRITLRAIDAALTDRALLLAQDDPPALFSQINAQFIARRQALADAIAQEQQAATRARAERHAALQVRDKLKDTLPVVRQSAEAFARLQREGFVGELMANDKQREAIEREQDLKAQEASLHALDAAIAQADSRITQLRSNFRSQLLTERVEAQATVHRLEQEHTKHGFRSTLLEVKAPQDGVVQEIATLAPGAVVPAGAALLAIVPKGEALTAEVALANEDVGFVEVGQSAKIKLAAYPFQKYGMLEGRVVHLGADAVDQQAAAKATGANPISAAALTYKAVIELTSQSLKLPAGGELRITPGMAISAEIHQGRRTVMEYLLSPVQRVSAEAGRER